MTTASISLSTVKPDFESLLLQLQLAVQDKSTWIDLQTSGTGETLLELFASVGTINQFGIESAAREGFLTTAVRSSSIYAITRMLGVRIHRKSPASVSITLSRTDSTVSYPVPKFTQFTVNGINYFNRNALVFAKGSLVAAERVFYGPITFDGTYIVIDTTKIGLSTMYDGQPFSLQINSGGGAGTTVPVTYSATYAKFIPSATTGLSAINSSTVASLFDQDVALYEGTITSESFTSDGVAFKELYLSTANFNISDLDVMVTVYNPSTQETTLWATIDDGIWTASATDKVYYDSTSGYGETVITFGDGYHGMIPALASTITCTYAVTSGSSSNTGITGQKVACASLNLAGITTSVISGGANQKTSEYYRTMAPQIFKARNRAVTASDWKSISCDFPGVVSASILGQRDIAPNDLRWMNVVQVCLLPIDTSVTALTSRNWEDYLTYMETRKFAAVHILRKDATELTARIELTLALKQSYTAAAILPVSEASIQALFARQSTTLGRRISVSDVVRAAAVTGVDYVDVTICTYGPTDVSEDLVPTDSTYFIALGTLTVNTKYSERTVYYGGIST
jgi:hypothetical protein